MQIVYTYVIIYHIELLNTLKGPAFRFSDNVWVSGYVCVCLLGESVRWIRVYNMILLYVCCIFCDYTMILQGGEDP